MADQKISITVPDAHVDSTLNGILRIMPNEEVDVKGDPKYTDKQWVTELTRRYLRNMRHRGLQLLANDAAIIPDDDNSIIAETTTDG